MSAQVLVVDDEPLIRASLRRGLEQEGFVGFEAGNLEEAWSQLQEHGPDVVVLDLKLGKEDGLELLAKIRKESPETQVLIITAHGSIESAVGAMKLGAYDFIKKPFDLEEVIVSVKNAVRTTRLERRVSYLHEQVRGHPDPMTLLFDSPAMRRIVEQLETVAASPVPIVLVVGESGTGKQLAARLLHDRSTRAQGTFVEINCSAIPEGLIESELFGHERGAFSDARERKLGLVEVADGGTLFLDEVGDLGLNAQAKLLTFLDQQTFRRVGSTSVRQVNVRIVAATNRDLSEMVGRREFREDLWYRLSALRLSLPPLRERGDDVALLARQFLLDFARQYSRDWRELGADALEILRQYPWPGNVRELRSAMSRAALLSDGAELRASHLPPELLVAATRPLNQTTSVENPQAPLTMAEVELAHLRRVLELCGGNRTLAAKHLGITRQTLSRKLSD